MKGIKLLTILSIGILFSSFLVLADDTNNSTTTTRTINVGTCKADYVTAKNVCYKTVKGNLSTCKKMISSDKGVMNLTKAQVRERTASCKTTYGTDMKVCKNDYAKARQDCKNAIKAAKQNRRG